MSSTGKETGLLRESLRQRFINRANFSVYAVEFLKYLETKDFLKELANFNSKKTNISTKKMKFALVFEELRGKNIEF